MKIKFPIIFLIAFLAFAGCYYTPDGDYFKKLDENGTPPYVEVELNFDTDTLYVWNNEWIYFHYTQNGDMVNWARFIIDGQETSPNDEKQGALELLYYLNGFSPGVHSLSMQLFTRSGTGSIADYFGAEGFLMQKDWVLIVVDNFGVASAITDTTFENGLLKLTWEKYKGLNFENYKIYKWVQPSGLPDQLVATITDQNQTSVTDPNYHGENSSYYVLVNDRYRGRSLQFEGPLPAVSATNNAEGNIVLHWEKPPFWKSLKGYRILEDEISWTSSGFVPFVLIDDPLIDSVVITDLYFAHKYDFWLQLDPNGTAYSENWTRPVHLATRTQSKVAYGFASPEFSVACAGTENKIYLISYMGGFISFNTETKEMSIPEDNPKLFRIYVSTNNNYIIGSKSENNDLLLYNLKHPENNKTIQMNEYITNPGHLASVSDQGTGIVLSGQKAVLFDYVNEQVLAEKELPYNGLYRNHVSGDGNYFTLDTYGGYIWYSCENNTITEMNGIANRESETLFSDFLPGDQTLVVTASYDHVSIYDCKTQELLHRWEFASGVETTVYHLVKASKEIFISEGEDLVLLDLTTGERTYLGKTRNTNKWELLYNNGQILWKEGRRLDVTDKL